MIKRLMAVLIAAVVLAGCNTLEGAGRDIERGGEKVQDAAGKAKK
jgi:entericidin B